MQYETIIGLEIHVQLKTKSKMFCSCPNVFDIDKPNTYICPICTGHPGVLPTVNEQAVNYAIKAALALNLQVNLFSKFDRKSYFYPDLPKGYQISQYDKPLAENGYLEILLPEGEKKFGIERLHLEEDAAKNFHQDGYVLVDFNRAGTPLIEIVTQPDFRSPAEAKAFLQELRLIMRYLGVSDADMEKGQLRCDANISLRPEGDTGFYPKTEIKNLNSFKSVERALAFEVKRQTELWEKGDAPDYQTTRGWDENRGVTVEQRGKEEASDYRYFPEPDIPPLQLTEEQVNKIKEEIPELPNDKRKRFIAHYGFKLPDANILVNNTKLARYAEKVISEFVAWLEASPYVEGTSQEIWDKYKEKIAKLASSWLLNNLVKLLNESGEEIDNIKITPEDMAEFLTFVFEKKLNSSAAQLVLSEMFKSGKDPHVILEEQDLEPASTEQLERWVEEVIAENPQQVEQFKGGKEPVIKFLIGMVMKKAKGKANAKEAEDLLRDKLSAGD